MAAVRGFFGLARGVLYLGALAIFVGMILINPLFTGWVGGLVTSESMRSDGQSEVEEKYFRVICPRYFEASTFERWTTPDLYNSGWCENYKDRL